MWIKIPAFHTANPSVSTKGDRRYPESGTASRKAHRRSGKTQHEFRYAHPKGPGCKVVPSLVDEHDEADGDHC